VEYPKWSTRLFPDLKSLPYKNRLNSWASGHSRKEETADLIEVFKMIEGLSATPWSFFSRRLGTHPYEDIAGNL